jgi:hypothetical protein
VADKEQLMLVVVYDANRNRYSISAHNQEPSDAQRAVEEWKAQPVPDRSLFVLDQTRRHRTADAQDCRLCREIVVRSAHVSPSPRFIRRK